MAKYRIVTDSHLGYEVQVNGPKGWEQPRVNTFPTIEAAEAFIEKIRKPVEVVKEYE